MLSRLSIKNYAIIDKLEIDFSKGLNIITGETGAGKSIIAGALGLILGQRADTGVLLSKENKCIVEGCFKGEYSDVHVNAFLLRNELDITEELVVRREINSNGKSRAFINDTPVNLGQLAELSKLLVDLHQQFDTLELGETDFQREVLDALGNNFKTLNLLKDAFEKAQRHKKEWELLKQKKNLFEKEIDFHQFQFTELEEAAFKENELEDLEQELKLMSNAEQIKNTLTKVYYDLEEAEEPVIRQIKSIISSLQSYSEMISELPALIERLQSSYVELQDIAEETERLNNHINSDPFFIEKANERLSTGYKLLKKHGVKTTNELLEIKQSLEEKLREVLNIDDEIAKAESAYKKLLTEAEELAAKISEARKEQVKPMETQVNKMLLKVGMPNALLKIHINKSDLNRTGYDDVEFLFDANKSKQFQPIRKIASGGELSRLMLCIKSLVARSMDMPTLIFDEIDTGISGEAAKQVGIILKEISLARQVICITHQPQIAGKADAHFLVFKSVVENSVKTGMRLLNKDERIVTIAKMLSGEKPTAAALENAREMMN